MRKKSIDFTLLWRKIFGKLDKPEERELEDWLTDAEKNLSYFKSLEALHKNRPKVSAQQQEDAWQKIQARINPASVPDKRRERRHISHYYYRAAAVFVVLAFTATLFWRYYSTDPDGNAEIRPGKSLATLATPDGRVIKLGENTAPPDLKGIPAKAEKSSLTYYTSATTFPPEEMNTLTVPRGGEFQLTLADGTKVWLNAESTIKFPSHFTGSTRTVILTGEAYFDVTRNTDKPFEVITQQQTISVLGTSFNVSAYPEDSGIFTTLVEGALEVSGQDGQSVLLHPGNQSVYDVDSGELTSRAVDTHTYTSWKNGLFIFDDEELGVILQRIGRWYNVSVQYDDTGLEHTRFTIHIDKYQPITEVLQLIEITKAVDFELENKTIIVQ